MDGHILGLSPNVARRRVVFKNRYGLEISGELYMEKGVDAEKIPALVIGAPYGETVRKLRIKDS